MEPTALPDLDRRCANRLLALVVTASVVCFVALAALASAQPASAEESASDIAPSAASAGSAPSGLLRTGVDGLDLGLIALTLVGVAILVRRHAPARS